MSAEEQIIANPVPPTQTKATIELNFLKIRPLKPPKTRYKFLYLPSAIPKPLSELN